MVQKSDCSLDRCAPYRICCTLVQGTGCRACRTAPRHSRVRWLEYHGVPSSVPVTHSGNALMLTKVSVSQANDLLDTSYQLYRHAKTSDIVVRTVAMRFLRCRMGTCRPWCRQHPLPSRPRGGRHRASALAGQPWSWRRRHRESS